MAETFSSANRNYKLKDTLKKKSFKLISFSYFPPQLKVEKAAAAKLRENTNASAKAGCKNKKLVWAGLGGKL